VQGFGLQLHQNLSQNSILSRDFNFFVDEKAFKFEFQVA
jgi:hypothetical protein